MQAVFQKAKIHCTDIYEAYLPLYGAVGGTHKTRQHNHGEEHCNGYILEDANAS